MIGIINDAVRAFIIDNYGSDTWGDVVNSTGIDRSFVSACPYPDEVTYKALACLAEIRKLDLQDVLEACGYYFNTMYIRRMGYERLLRCMGGNLVEFLQNLNIYHLHLSVSFKEMQPPAFNVDDVTPESLIFHYASKRPGLTRFAIGLLKGAAWLLYDTEIQVEVLRQRGDPEEPPDCADQQPELEEGQLGGEELGEGQPGGEEAEEGGRQLREPCTAEGALPNEKAGEQQGEGKREQAGGGGGDGGVRAVMKVAAESAAGAGAGAGAVPRPARGSADGGVAGSTLADHDTFLIRFPPQSSLLEQCSAAATCRLSLDPPTLFQLFPFHMVLDAECRLVQVGRALSRLYPQMKPGRPLTDFFKLRHPYIPLTFEHIMEQPDNLFVLRSCINGMELKGQMQYLQMPSGAATGDSITKLDRMMMMAASSSHDSLSAMGHGGGGGGGGGTSATAMAAAAVAALGSVAEEGSGPVTAPGGAGSGRSREAGGGRGPAASWSGDAGHSAHVLKDPPRRGMHWLQTSSRDRDSPREHSQPSTPTSAAAAAEAITGGYCPYPHSGTASPRHTAHAASTTAAGSSGGNFSVPSVSSPVPGPYGAAAGHVNPHPVCHGPPVTQLYGPAPGAFPGGLGMGGAPAAAGGGGGGGGLLGPGSRPISRHSSSSGCPFWSRNYQRLHPGSDVEPVMLFLGSPRIGNVTELRTYGLYVSDLPLFDNSREMILMAEQRTAEAALKDTFERLSLQLEEERQRSEQLLYQMIPPHIADSLRRGRRVNAETYPEATILFSDIVNFTTIAAGSTAMEVCNMLDDLYNEFDALIDKYPALYKVETIGDAYMLVANVTQPCADHVDVVLDFALDMHTVCNRVTTNRGAPIQIRVGVHTGSVVGGVVGRKMPRFHLFGDAVNTASRMESHGLAGTVHISAASRALITNPSKYLITERGEITVKGKGLMETFLVSRADAPAPAHLRSILATTAAAAAEFAHVPAAPAAATPSGRAPGLAALVASRGASASSLPTLGVVSSGCTASPYASRSQLPPMGPMGGQEGEPPAAAAGPPQPLCDSLLAEAEAVFRPPVPRTAPMAVAMAAGLGVPPACPIQCSHPPAPPLAVMGAASAERGAYANAPSGGVLLPYNNVDSFTSLYDRDGRCGSGSSGSCATLPGDSAAAATAATAKRVPHHGSDASQYDSCSVVATAAGFIAAADCSGGSGVNAAAAGLGSRPDSGTASSFGGEFGSSAPRASSGPPSAMPGPAAAGGTSAAALANSRLRKAISSRRIREPSFYLRAPQIPLGGLRLGPELAGFSNFLPAAASEPPLEHTLGSGSDFGRDASDDAATLRAGRSRPGLAELLMRPNSPTIQAAIADAAAAASATAPPPALRAEDMLLNSLAPERARSPPPVLYGGDGGGAGGGLLAGGSVAERPRSPFTGMSLEALLLPYDDEFSPPVRHRLTRRQEDYEGFEDL